MFVKKATYIDLLKSQIQLYQPYGNFVTTKRTPLLMFQQSVKFVRNVCHS